MELTSYAEKANEYLEKLRDAITVINRQQKEIEGLNEEVTGLRRGGYELRETIHQLEKG